ncbi:putative phage tail protein [Acinetobacter junii]|uniref:putative phage tail protein n=1 Tax=Acinetobacter junii TaxID=40215 RepID=UPI00124E3BDC|nr:putative phage tail protein [Acinetobacter junii]
MTFEQTIELYSAVLRQLLPAGGYDISPNTNIAKDIYGHAKVLAQADVDAKRILSVLDGVPEELIDEYETALGLPLKCTVNATKTVEERLRIIHWIRQTRNVLNRTYLKQLLALFGVELIDLVRFKPIQCTASCTSPVNTERLRYKVKLILKAPVQADMACIIENYLPAYLRYDIKEQS